MKDEDKTREQLISELVEMHRQIIKLQKLETRQRRAEEELRNISEGSGDAMRLIDRDFNILRCNAEMAELIGKPAEGMIGAKCYDQLSGAFCHTEDCALRRTLRGEERVNVEIVKKTRNGRKIPLELIATPLTREGQVIGVIESFRDITERKQAGEALRESEEKYRALFEMAKDAILLSDETGRFVDVNQAACKSLGYSREELLRLSNREIDADPRGYEAFLKIRNRPLKGMTFEVNQRRKDGTLLPVEITGSFFTTGGQRIALAIARDITERKRTEEKLKSSLREKEVLLREIHHRVKNNMQVISSLLDMMIMRTQNQEALDLLENARIKIYTMALIHSQLYRSDKFDQIDMDTHARELVNYLMSINIDKDVSIKSVVDCSDIYLTVNQAIPCALVINELIFNSLKHAFKGRKKGKIGVSLKKLSEAMALLKVQDDGIGMPEEIDIFKTNTLGLKLIKNIVCNQLKGKIRVDRGIGTTFIIEFKL